MLALHQSVTSFSHSSFHSGDHVLLFMFCHVPLFQYRSSRLITLGLCLRDFIYLTLSFSIHLSIFYTVAPYSILIFSKNLVLPESLSLQHRNI